MEVTLERNTGLADVAVKLEQEEKPCGLLQWESSTFPRTSSGSPLLTIKPEKEERLCKDDSREREFGFADMRVKEEEEEEPCSLHQSEAETSPASSSGFPDIIMKEEEEEGPSYHQTAGSPSGFSHTVIKLEGEKRPRTQEDSVESPVGEQSGADIVDGAELAAVGGQPVDSADTAAKKVRGVAWQRAETIALLRLWGEEHVQEQLRSSHRNIETFELIARAMHKRGFHRSANECRTKTKSLRQQYKYALQEIGKSGNNPKTCPHFELLDSILRGDPSVKALRLSDSHEVPDIAEVLDKTDTTVTLDFVAVKEDPTAHIEDMGEASNIESSCSSRCSADAFDPAVCNPTATLDPATRLGNIRRRKEKSAKGESLVHAMLRCASRDSREMVDEMRRLSREDNKVFAEMRDTMAREAASLERYREQLLARIDRNTDIFADLAKEMTSMVRRLSERESRGPATGNENDARGSRTEEERPGPVVNVTTKRKPGAPFRPAVVGPKWPKWSSLANKGQHCPMKRRNTAVSGRPAREGVSMKDRVQGAAPSPSSGREPYAGVTEEEGPWRKNRPQTSTGASSCPPEKRTRRPAKTFSPT